MVLIQMEEELSLAKMKWILVSAWTVPKIKMIWQLGTGRRSKCQCHEPLKIGTRNTLRIHIRPLKRSFNWLLLRGSPPNKCAPGSVTGGRETNKVLISRKICCSDTLILTKRLSRYSNQQMYTPSIETSICPQARPHSISPYSF